jgi:uncharacterized iron-regulated membrane protein
MAASADRPSSRRSWRRILELLHFWIGFVLCVPLAVLGVTGSLLVFDDELAALLGEAPPRAAAAAVPSFDAVAGAAAASAGQEPALVIMPEEPGRPAAVRFGARPGAGATLFVDPVSLEILGRRDGPGDGVVRWIHLLHANLLVRDRAGRAAVGWLGVAMLALGVSGLVLWWPRDGRWRQAFGVRRKARGARFHRELHGMAGIWGLAVFLVVSFSGVYLAFPETVGGAFRAAGARDPRAAPRIAPTPGAPKLPLDEAAALAAAALPAARPLMLALPARPDQPIRISLALPGHAHGEPMATVFVDPGARRVVELRDPRAFSAAEGLLAWQRPLHAGRGLGPAWRLLVFLSGLLPLLFAVTGVSMWWLKRRNRRAGEAPRALLAQPGE